MSQRPGIIKCLNATCRDASRLLTEQEERAISWPERTGLFLHLLICRSCRRYRRGVIYLRQLMRKAGGPDLVASNESLPAPARERIRDKVSKV